MLAGHDQKITSANYKTDKRYPQIAKAVSAILATGNVVTPVDVLIRTERLTKQKYEDWRFGRVPYLERVCLGSLGKLNSVLRVLDQHSKAIGLKAKPTIYHKWGRGGKRIVLRFSKSGDEGVEAAYSRPYIKATEKIDNHPDSDETTPT